MLSVRMLVSERICVALLHLFSQYSVCSNFLGVLRIAIRENLFVSEKIFAAFLLSVCLRALCG